MYTPSSFCTICTKTCKQELVGFLLSLSVHHPNASCHVMCDTETKKFLDILTPQPKLNLKWYVTLDKYSKHNRQEMCKLKIWDEFQMMKAEVIRKALEVEKDTLFLDSDIVIFDKIDGIDHSKQIGVSPQFIQKKNVDQVGYYNGGVLWTNQKSLPDNWIKYTKTSRYHDQASVEDLAKIYPKFEFGENYNLQTWRFMLGLEPRNKIMNSIVAKPNLGKVFYKDKPLKFYHTHFNSPQFKIFNDYIISKLQEASCYRELLCISRLINNKWTIQMPKQPRNDMFRHVNDSFREIPNMLKQTHSDIQVVVSDKSGHIWLEPQIAKVMLYDRPTLNWMNDEVKKTNLLLIGNGSMELEGAKLKAFGARNVKPWIFWPRSPTTMEKVLREKGLLGYNQRTNESVFIGNFENPVQQKFRITPHKWETVITEYHCTKGHAQKFTQEQYLMKLRNSKFGISLRGFGSKCHREVELMAFGTVLIVTPEVSTKSYMEPLIENKHYLLVRNPAELKEKVKNLSQEKWEEMSKACIEWYDRNVRVKNLWTNTMSHILWPNN